MISFIVTHEAHYDHFSKIWFHLKKNEFNIITCDLEKNFFNNSKLDNLSKFDCIDYKNLKDQFFDVSLTFAFPHLNLIELDIYKKNFKKNFLYTIFSSEKSLVETEQYKYFDEFLVFNEYTYEFLTNIIRSNNIKKFNYPRFDNINFAEFDYKHYSIKKILFKLIKKKINIFYSPTHAHEGSIDQFSQKIWFLKFFFNFYVKLHLDTYEENPEAIEKLQRNNCKLVDESFFYSRDFKKIDLIIADNGGSILLPFYFKKLLLILIDNIPKETQKYFIKKNINFIDKKNLNIISIIKSFLSKNRNACKDISKKFFVLNHINGKKIAHYLKKI